MGLTQEALAQYLETKREYIGYYEIGQRSIPSSQLTKLANLFCMNEYDFYEADVQNKNINIAFLTGVQDFCLAKIGIFCQNLITLKGFV